MTPTPSRETTPAGQGLNSETPGLTSPDIRIKRTRLAEGERAARTETPPPREHTSPPGEEDSVMNPRTVKSMPKRGAPAPVAKLLYPWPDPLEQPEGVEGDPHRKLTRDSETAPPIPKSRVAYTDAVFQRLYIPLDTLLDNLRDEQSAQIRACPEEFLAVIPYGAGAALLKENKHLNRDYLAFLRTFRFADTELADSMDEALAAIIEVGSPEQVEASLRVQDAKNPDTLGLQLSMPISNRRATSRDKYASPWALFLRGGSKRLRDFLLYQQTFAVDKNIAFSVLTMEAKTPSWVLANLKGDVVSPDRKDDLMKAIKQKLWLDDRFRKHVTKVHTKIGIPGDVNAHAVKATNSFTLTFFENLDASGNPATVVQIRGRPIATNDSELKEYHDILRGTQYWVDGMHLLTRAGTILCQQCKAVTHPAYDCPFLKTEGWFGPTNEGAERPGAQAESSRGRRGRGSATRRGGAPTGRGRK